MAFADLAAAVNSCLPKDARLPQPPGSGPPR